MSNANNTYDMKSAINAMGKYACDHFGASAFARGEKKIICKAGSSVQIHLTQTTDGAIAKIVDKENDSINYEMPFFSPDMDIFLLVLASAGYKKEAYTPRWS